MVLGITIDCELFTTLLVESVSKVISPLPTLLFAVTVKLFAPSILTKL